MRNLLEEPRDIAIGGMVETVRNYAYLAQRGEVIIETMQEIESELDDRPDDAAADWAQLANLASLLSEVLAAQDQWLADYDAAIAAEVESVRQEIRNFNVVSDTDEAETRT